MLSRAPIVKQGRLVLVPVVGILAGLFALSALEGCMGSDAHAQAAPAAPSVTVSLPLSRSVVEWDEYVGRFAPSETVDVRPRVSGEIVERHFRDGQTVKKGDLLFTIDPRPFQAADAEARASVASAQSALDLAKTDLGRATRLQGDEAVSAGELDSLRAKMQAADANLKGAQARLASRALDLEFTQIRAPISGVVSDRRIDVGNQVVGGEGASSTLLTTINALDPINFVFDASEALYLKGQRARGDSHTAPTVEVRLQDEANYEWKGTVDFVDNGLDPHSGTIRGRATFANPKKLLMPGMVGDMRLANGSGDVKALLVPDAAVQNDQARKTVLVVNESNTLVARPVGVGPVVNGLRVVRTGLSPSDRVVIEGMALVPPGTKVTPVQGHIADVQATPAEPSVPIAAQVTIAQ